VDCWRAMDPLKKKVSSAVDVSDYNPVYNLYARLVGASKDTAPDPHMEFVMQITERAITVGGGACDWLAAARRPERSLEW